MGNGKPLEHHVSIKYTTVRTALGPWPLVKIKYSWDESGNVFQMQWHKLNNYVLEILLWSNRKEFMFGFRRLSDKLINYF